MELVPLQLIGLHGHSFKSKDDKILKETFMIEFNLIQK